MSARNVSFFLILSLLVGCQQAVLGQEVPSASGAPNEPASGAPNEPAAEAPKEPAAATSESDQELQLYQSALMKPGSDWQMRLDAANLLLVSAEPAARKILIGALRSETAAARSAVCEALSRARASEKPVSASEEFLPPLVEVLRTEEDAGVAKLAAEASLLFSYEQVGQALEEAASDGSLPVTVRLNVLHALTLHEDRRAVIKLIELVDDREEQIVARSKAALGLMGLPTGDSREDRKRIIGELEQQNPERFLRNRLMLQAERIRQLEGERDLWREQYLAALERIYAGLADNAAKGKFLAEYLVRPESCLRLWALEKVSQWRRGGTSDLPAEIGPALLGLIGDEQRAVRLRTARLLALMPELPTAERLAGQHAIEKDAEVRTEIFVALGVRCSYAAMTTPPVKLPPEIVEKTLGWASEYLSAPEPQTARKGAEVMKKLLERDGLAAETVGKYLQFFVDRYKQQDGNAKGVLRGALLGLMAQLCVEGSACKAQAGELFASLFEEALGDSNDRVRVAAVDGLISLGQGKVVLGFGKGSLLDDASVGIRRKVVGLAGEVGTAEDLGWLGKKAGLAEEGDLAWEAMVKIFRKSEASVVGQWVERFRGGNTEKWVTDERKLTVLEIAEQKAQDNPEMLKKVREDLGRLYGAIGDFQRAAQYWGLLHQSASSEQEKGLALPLLLDSYLRWPNTDRAASLIDNCLLIKDLDPNGPVVATVEQFVANPPAGVDPNKVFQELVDKVKEVGDRPVWQEHRKRWDPRSKPAKEPEKASEAAK